MGGKYSVTHSSSQCNPNTSGSSFSCTVKFLHYPPTFHHLCVCVGVGGGVYVCAYWVYYEVRVHVGVGGYTCIHVGVYVV